MGLFPRLTCSIGQIARIHSVCPAEPRRDDSPARMGDSNVVKALPLSYL